jgi:hypothetical protein
LQTSRQADTPLLFPSWRIHNACFDSFIITVWRPTCKLYPVEAIQTPGRSSHCLNSHLFIRRVFVQLSRTDNFPVGEKSWVRHCLRARSIGAKLSLHPEKKHVNAHAEFNFAPVYYTVVFVVIYCYDRFAL